MKKTILTIICAVSIVLAAFMLFRQKEDSNLTKIKVAEVTHSVFYAPQYLAIANGYFEEEGLDVELILTPGADKVMSAVLSGDVQIGFSGSEATIYVYNGGEEDYVMTFAGLTQKDGSFLVSREKYDNFSLDNLKGKTIIGGRVGGMPEMTLEWALRENEIDPKKDVTIDTSIAFSAMQGAFLSGIGDFVTLFEPNATDVEKNGLGYIVAYVGQLGGNVPYTAYNAKKSYIDKNPDVIEGFTKAINKALKFTNENDSNVIAEKILSFFPDTSLTDLVTIIDHYKEGDAWKKDISITKEEWTHMQDIIIASGELDDYAPYEDLIYNKYFIHE